MGSNHVLQFLRRLCPGGHRSSGLLASCSTVSQNPTHFPVLVSSDWLVLLYVIWKPDSSQNPTLFQSISYHFFWFLGTTAYPRPKLFLMGLVKILVPTVVRQLVIQCGLLLFVLCKLCVGFTDESEARGITVAHRPKDGMSCLLWYQMW